MTWRERIQGLDPVILWVTCGLVIFGLAMLMSASGPIAVQRTGNSLFYVRNQLLKGVFPGALAFLFFSFLDYKRLKSLAFIGLIASIIALLLVYIPGIGVMINGARGWVRLGMIQFQPSEIAKLSFVIYLAAWLSTRKGDEAHRIDTGLLPFLGALGAVMLLLILQPDTGSMMVIVATALLLYFLSGAPVGWFVGLSGIGAGLLWALIKFSPYRTARFTVFLHPELDPQGIGYHINQAILAIGSGGFWGVGYGHSRQKFLYLPEVESDSISAVIAEEMGFVVIALLLSALGVLVWRCFKIAKEARDPFAAYIAAGIGGWIAVQAVVNIGSMSGLMPMTGVTLPFISYGGSAMTIMLAAMGIVAGIPYRQSHRRV
ncbi:putative lipid II flippase FtsW [Patescibacteria group bacterium]|nr:putative lipid II flippase FtsW [Patescibacteria group bacterium]